MEVIKLLKATFWDSKDAGENYIDTWFLMSSPFPVLLILASYLYFVLRCGPKFMEKRPPYKLTNILLVYNALQVAYSVYLFYIGITAILEYGLTEKGCYSTEYNHELFRLLSGHHLYFIAKLTEFLDTVFFVLRKKSNQITFLHVYHHSTMYFGTWLSLKYEPSYSYIFLGTLNSFVHVIMYTYYGLSGFPGLSKYLWWKKYLTSLQLIQFLLIIIQVTWNWNVSTCPISYILISITWGNLILFVYLFTVFYIRSYMQKRKGLVENATDRRSQEKANHYTAHVSGMSYTKASHVD